MNDTITITWRRAILMAVACGLLSAVLVAQNTGSGSASAKLQAHPEAAGADQTSVGKAHDNTYVIGLDDVLNVNVWKEPEVSRTVPVRSDGKISLPLAGEVQASGSTPKQLEQELASRLRSFISDPEVTVIVEQIRSQKFNILGQVMRPGAFPLTNSPTVLDAIALAGGFRDFAKQKAIYVLRQNGDGTQSRLPFNYKDVIKGKNSEQNIKLQPNDTIVVP